MVGFWVMVFSVPLGLRGLRDARKTVPHKRGGSGLVGFFFARGTPGGGDGWVGVWLSALFTRPKGARSRGGEP